MPSLFEPAVAENMLQRINSLRADNKKLWGKMSVAQMLHHVRLVFDVANEDLHQKTTLIAKLMGGLIKKMVLDSKPYKQSLPTGKGYIVVNDKNFEEEKTLLLNALHKFLTRQAVIHTVKHPLFGHMAEAEWGFAQWKHLDHHLRQFSA